MKNFYAFISPKNTKFNDVWKEKQSAAVFIEHEIWIFYNLNFE
jgi:hypothetical protein